jgi:hypothetical protein
MCTSGSTTSRGGAAPSAIPEAHGIRISTDLWPESALNAEPLCVENGWAIPSASPGSGVEWNEQAIAQCLG